MARNRDGKKLRQMIAKVNATKKPSAKEERAQTAKVRSHDVTPDPYLAGIMAKSEGKDPIAAIEDLERVSKRSKLAQRVLAGVERKRVREAGYVSKVAAQADRPIRREIPDPVGLTELMAPSLPPRAAGDKPNIIALIYAFRAFQQFSHGFTRRKLGDPASREIYYQERKQIFMQAMKDLGMYDQFDWSDF